MQELLRTNDLTVIAFATALLEGEGIAAFAMDVHMSILDGSMGILPQRVLYESVSRNTHENAVFSAAVPGVNPADSWLLLTSAYHMPRALATF